MKLQLLLPWNVCILWAFNTLPGAAGSKGAIPVFINTSVQFSSVTQSCLTLCDPVDCSTPGFPVLHHLLELAQAHVHQIDDAIQPPIPLLHVFPNQLQFSRSVMSDSCDSKNRSTPGLPVQHQLPEFTHTHVHRVGDAIQPSHPLSSPSPPAPNPSQHQSLFQ